MQPQGTILKAETVEKASGKEDGNVRIFDYERSPPLSIVLQSFPCVCVRRSGWLEAVQQMRTTELEELMTWLYTHLLQQWGSLHHAIRPSRQTLEFPHQLYDELPPPSPLDACFECRALVVIHY